jgi:hypothetical protein
MVLLNTMTEASAETRLVFLTWLSVFGMAPTPANSDWLASVLHVTKKQLKVALEYLVEEGYLLKNRNYYPTDIGQKKAVKYCYIPIAECWDEWANTLKHMKFPDAFKYALEGKVYQTSHLPKKPRSLNVPERLTLATLISYTNSAFYVVGFDQRLNSQLLGMPVTKLTKILRSLTSNGYISTLAEKVMVMATTTSGSLSAIYEITITPPGYKRISLGMPRVEGLEVVTFLFKLKTFYEKAIKQTKPDVYPHQSSPLPDKYYLELSKVFQDKKLTSYTHHLCQSIIFSTVSDYLFEMGYRNDLELKNALQQSIGKLEESIRYKLSNAILNGQNVSSDINLRKLENTEPDSVEALAILTNYTIAQLSMELAHAVYDIIKRLTLFLDIYRIPLHITGYLPKAVMAVFTKSIQCHYSEIQCQAASQTQIRAESSTEETVAVLTDFILTLLVPSHDYLNDCYANIDELVAVESTLKDHRIQVVDKVAVIRPKTAKR